MLNMTSKNIFTKQPVAISPKIEVIRPYYKAALQLENQKFGRDDNIIRQYLLEEDINPEDKEYIVNHGINNLTKNEDRALSAIQILLDKTNYQGNIEGKIIESSAYKWTGYIPRLSITYSDYYEAYGLTKSKDQYEGKQRQEALYALKSLSQPKRIWYETKKTDKFGKTKADIVRVTMPLITFAESYKDLEEEEADKVKAGQDLPEKRQTKLVIEISPLMVYQIDSWYLLKPTTLHSEIQALYPGRNYSPAILAFINWLLTLDKSVIRISRDKLAIKINLGKYLEDKRQNLLNKRIQEALQTALTLGYLTKYEVTPLGVFELTLNPDRCKRINRKRRGRKKKEDQ